MREQPYRFQNKFPIPGFIDKIESRQHLLLARRHNPGQPPTAHIYCRTVALEKRLARKRAHVQRAGGATAACPCNGLVALEQLVPV